MPPHQRETKYVRVSPSLRLPHYFFLILGNALLEFFLNVLEELMVLPLADYNNFKTLQIKFGTSTGSLVLLLINKA